jgi:type IV fimbrial biogenesis protein FimT
MLTAARPRGFTLIELMIGLALFALVMMLAMPTFTTMLQNARLRGVAESVQAGVQMARAEALRRNQTVEFLLTKDDPDPANVTTLAPNTNGPNWAVRLDGSASEDDFIEGRAAPEGGGDSIAQIAATYPAAPAPFPADRIQFDGLGRVRNVGANNATIDVQTLDATQCKAAGGDRTCLRIVITPGGRVRMCDPSVTGTADTRAC